MNKLIVETYFANFENYDMFAAAVEPLKAKGVGVELHIFDDSDFNRRLCARITIPPFMAPIKAWRLPRLWAAPPRKK